MRLPIAALCALFLAATLVGCGGETPSYAPPDAKLAPPPGTTDTMLAPPTKSKGGIESEKIPANAAKAKKKG